MQYTTNYSLKKPQYGDTADIADINDNSDSVDNLIHQNRTMIAPAFDSTKAYVVGDPVVYLGELFVFIANKAAGAWDATKVEPTTAAEMGGGGASALADLDDVEITNPSTGQALLFDDDDDVWKNQNLPDVSVTKEASGNPIEITDAAAAPLVKCVTEITGSQDLHGYDKPWVGGAGKNKYSGPSTKTVNRESVVTFDSDLPSGVCIFSAIIDCNSPDETLSVVLRNANNNIIGTIYLDHDSSSRTYGIANITTDLNNIVLRAGNTYASALGYTATYTDIMIEYGSYSGQYEPYSNICPITAYTEGEIEVRGKNLFNESFEQGTIVNGDNRVNTNTIRFANQLLLKSGTYTVSIKSSKTLQTSIVLYDSNGDWVRDLDAQWHSFPYTFTLTSSYNVRFVVNYANGTLAPTEVSQFQIERGTTATAYEPYTATTHTTTYPSAIYRGSEDVVNGEVTEEWRFLEFDGSSDENWSYNNNNALWRITIPNAFIVTSQTQRNVYTVNNLFEDKGWADRTGNGTVGLFYGESQLYLKYAQITTEVDLRTFLSTNPLQVAYQLATPTTSSVTPTNLPIKSLSGYTHIESSTGEMEVEYISGNYQALVDLIQSSSHVYSTAEQVVGKWIDGSEIYEKTFVIDNTVSGSWAQVAHGISNLDLVVSMNGFFKRTSDGNMFPLWVWEDANTFIVVEVTASNIEYKSRLTTGTMFVTLRYTKSTQTRSLSAPVTSQKAQIEPLTDQTEEVPTEEEKTAEKPETEEENDER